MDLTNEVLHPLCKFTFYPIERISRGIQRGGVDDEDFDPAILPYKITDLLTIEDVSTLIAEDEFDIYRPVLGKYLHDHINIKHAIVHRFPRYEIDASNHIIKFEVDMVNLSRNLVGSAAACLRLIRPTTQYLGLFHGDLEDGKFRRIGFDTPVDGLMNPISHRTLGFRTSDAETLKFYLPLFLKGMSGPFWKFQMAVKMHESGHFQNDSRAKFFLWTTAVESLFTTKSQQGSLVGSERIKSFLGPKSPIYPPGELSSVYINPNHTVEEVVGELYCLRNHIAHGDRIPPYYSQQPGRQDIYSGDIARFEMLLEAISFIIRHSLLKILSDNLVDEFADASSTDAYFGAKNLNKKALENLRIPAFKCPQ